MSVGFITQLAGQTTDLVDAMAVKPSMPRIHAINNLILTLTRQDLWDALGFLYVYMAHDSQASLIDWKDPSSVASAVNSPVFAVDSGWSSDGSTSYISDGVAINSTPGWGQTDAAYGALYATTSSSANILAGTAGGQQTVLTNSTGNRINSLLGDPTIGVNQPAGIHMRVIRINTSLTKELWTDGTTVTAGTTTQTPANNPRSALRASSSYSPASITMRARFGGSYMSDDYLNSLSSALSQYSTALR